MAISKKIKDVDAFYRIDQIAVMPYMLVERGAANCQQLPMKSVCRCSVHLDGEDSKDGLSTKLELAGYCATQVLASCLNCEFELFEMKCSNFEAPPLLKDYVVLFNELANVNLYDETTIDKFLENLSIKPRFNNKASNSQKGCRLIQVFQDLVP